MAWTATKREAKPLCCCESAELSSSLVLAEKRNLYGSSTALLANLSPISSFDVEQKNDSKTDKNPSAINDDFFIRPALFVDMDRASKILADGFFKGPKTNWFTYQYEKFVTYLSLEAGFPRTQQQRSRYEIYVACSVKTGEVWGIAEIDARGKHGGERTMNVYEKSGGSPYMCNLAIDEKQKRKGIATSLVNECEQQVMEWYCDNEKIRSSYRLENDLIYNSKGEMINDVVGRGDVTSKINNSMRNSICLKVRESNKAAVRMYLKLGYITISEELENPLSCENILLMRKELSRMQPTPLQAAEYASE